MLIEQIENRVRWRESIQYMIKNGVKKFIEIGRGKVLTGLLYINTKAKDLKETLDIVDTPLNKLVESDLCPGKEKINQINASLK